MDERVSTGIAELDAALDGGLLIGKKALVRGATGIGKSILGVHIANQGRSQYNHPGVIIDVNKDGDEQLQEIYASEMFDWDMQIAEGLGALELHELQENAVLLRDFYQYYRGFFLKQHFPFTKAVIVDGSDPFAEEDLAHEVLLFFAEPHYHTTVYREPLWSHHYSEEEVMEFLEKDRHVSLKRRGDLNFAYGYASDLVWVQYALSEEEFPESMLRKLEEQYPEDGNYVMFLRSGLEGEYLGKRPEYLVVKEAPEDEGSEESSVEKRVKIPEAIGGRLCLESLEVGNRIEEEERVRILKELLEEVGEEEFLRLFGEHNEFYKATEYGGFNSFDKRSFDFRIDFPGYCPWFVFNRDHLVPRGSLPINFKQQWYSDQDFATVVMETAPERSIFDLVNQPIPSGAMDATINTIICMGYIPRSEQNPQERRALAVTKHRGSKHDSSIFEYEITDNGIQITGKL